MWELFIFFLGVIASTMGYILSKQYEYLVKEVESLEAEANLSEVLLSEMELTNSMMLGVVEFHERDPFSSTGNFSSFPYTINAEALSTLRNELMKYSRLGKSRLVLGTVLDNISSINSSVGLLRKMVLEAKSEVFQNEDFRNDLLSNRKLIVQRAKLVQNAISKISDQLSIEKSRAVSERNSLLKKHPFAGFLGRDFWKE